jgi:hypothetical protein
MVFGKDVAIHVKDTDKYGRTVADVILPDGRTLNRELVRAGLAWWYRKYSTDESQERWKRTLGMPSVACGLILTRDAAVVLAEDEKGAGVLG